jgi:hypothetical protein
VYLLDARRIQHVGAAYLQVADVMPEGTPLNHHMLKVE